MAAKRDPALEVEEQVLANRLDALQSLAVEPGGEVQRRGTGVRCLDLDALPDQTLQAKSGTMDAVPFGHLNGLGA